MAKERPKYLELGKLIETSRGNRYSQKQLGQLLGVSDKQVNMVENGIRRFSIYRTRKIAEILNLDFDEISVLSNYDPLVVYEKFDTPIVDFLSAKDLINQSRERIELAGNLREIGWIPSTLELLSFWINALRKGIKEKRGLLKEIKEMKYLLIDAFCVRIVCNNEIQFHQNVMNSITDDYNDAIDLAKEINYLEGLGTAELWMGDGHYIAGEYEKALKSIQKALPLLKPNTRVYSDAFRDLMLCHAHMDDRNGLNKCFNMSIDEIDKGRIDSPAVIASQFEGYAKSLVTLGDVKCMPALDSAETYIQQSNRQFKYNPLIEMQINRTRLRFFEKMKLQKFTIIDTAVSNYADKAKELLMSLPGHDRHKNEIDQILVHLGYKEKNGLEEYKQLKFKL